jgi:hypothetical protein
MRTDCHERSAVPDNACHPDGSVTRFKGYPAMTDWYFENSEYGWDISTKSPHAP